MESSEYRSLLEKLLPLWYCLETYVPLLQLDYFWVRYPQVAAIYLTTEDYQDDCTRIRQVNLVDIRFIDESARQDIHALLKEAPSCVADYEVLFDYEVPLVEWSYLNRWLERPSEIEVERWEQEIQTQLEAIWNSRI